MIRFAGLLHLHVVLDHATLARFVTHHADGLELEPSVTRQPGQVPLKLCRGKCGIERRSDRWQSRVRRRVEGIAR